ncbi:PREDICTED: DNA repair protein RAD52 homolog [Wasmannia auropunctata]|uniref:DNA repair protein RAD52 homolog n=1 Tax=Wasmannia auropunctata TaxID=64793 RepID=UPI0005EE72BC|nr:PREDICTED: DNA repair protein RAD52 homolog [Wasmannia auropunctata]
MYNGHEYLSCIKIPATVAAKQAAMKSAQRPEKAEPMDLAADHRDLILTANKVFGEGKWSHTVVSQTLDFVDVTGAKCCVGCVSFVRVQLESGAFHEDIGYHSAEESAKGLSIHNARVGSAVNALKRVLLSFGDRVERELQQLRRQINPEQAGDVRRGVSESDKQISEKSSVSVKAPGSHVLQTERTSEPETNKNSDLLTTEPAPISIVNNNNTTEANPSSSVKTESAKIVRSFSNDETISTIEQKLKSKALPLGEKQRLERKRKQLEKQMEFKRRMMEKEGLMTTDDNKPNPNGDFFG